MFKKKCGKCGKKADSSFDFCPFCGNHLEREREERDYGLLGRKDDINFPGFNIKMPFMFDKLFNSLLKEVDSQFKELDKRIGEEQVEQPKSQGISIRISTGFGKQPEIKISGFGPEFNKTQEKPVKAPIQEITEDKARQLATLPKKEAETKVRRLSNKIVYELELPGVKNLKDVIINRLENSIEIKAFSKENVYFKLIPVGLPILGYALKDEKLVVELRPR